MKKGLRKTTALALAAIVLCLGLTSCTAKVEKSDFAAAYSLNGSAKFLTASGAQSKASLSGKDGDYLDITFDAAVTLDTVVLYEKDENVTSFEILAKQDGEFVSIYEQDKIGSFRYCAFPDTKTDALRIKINSTKEGSFNIKSIEVLNVQHTRERFKVTAYAVANTIYNAENLDPAHLNTITDMILFGAVTFDESGALHFSEYELDGETVSGKDVLTRAIENIRAAQGENSVKIHINLLGPSADDYMEKEQKHTDIFKNYTDVLTENIVALLNSYSVDGVYFDYEYPYTNKAWRAYSDFLVKLDEALGAKYSLGSAMGPWGKRLSAKARDAVDSFEVMAYDLADEDGYHASFASVGGALSLNFMQEKDYDIAKCNLGVPFYARPVDMDALWLDYASASERLGKYGNVDTAPIDVADKVGYTVPRYFNSYQMIFDKTAFAYDYGAGGMMVWHYACDLRDDSGLSLFSAMREAIISREG